VTRWDVVGTVALLVAWVVAFLVVSSSDGLDPVPLPTAPTIVEEEVEP